MRSEVQERGVVPFPAYTGERIYMKPFTKKDGLPVEYKRWQETVDAMLDGIDAIGTIHLMVDQAPIQQGRTHRRPGLHVDGYWRQELNEHWRHGQNSTTPNEQLILATDILGCAAYLGEYEEAAEFNGGDYSHLDVSNFEKVEMAPGRAWMGHTLSMLHASIPHALPGLRTLVRLNVRLGA